MARPPLQKARQLAVKDLIAAHQDEYDKLVTDRLASVGWAQEEVVQTKWVSKPAS